MADQHTSLVSPLPPQRELVSELTDSELDVELTIVAAALVPSRPERYWQLLRERDRRRGILTAEPAA